MGSRLDQILCYLDHGLSSSNLFQVHCYHAIIDVCLLFPLSAIRDWMHSLRVAVADGSDRCGDEESCSEVPVVVLVS